MPEIGLDLGRYLGAIADCRYAIVKLPAHFPALHVGEDLDIVAVDKEQVVRKLLLAARQDIEAGFRARVTYGPEGAYIHTDILDADAVHLRFDVASTLPSFGSYRVRDAYTERILEAAGRRDVAIRGATVPIRVAGELDELVVRYLEYYELFSSRPDKVKHLEYVLQAVDEEPERKRFLDRLHANIVLPADEAPAPADARRLRDGRTRTRTRRRVMLERLLGVEATERLRRFVRRTG